MSGTESTESPKSRRRARRKPYPWQRRRRRLLVWFVGLPLVLLSCRLYLAVKVSHELAAVRAQGYPVTLEELDAWYPAVPEEENAANLYQEALKAWRGLPPERMDLLTIDEKDRPARSAPLPDEVQAAIDEYVRINTAALDLLHRAALMPRCRFALDFTKGQAVDLRHLYPLRTGAQLLAFAVEVAVEEGDAERAVGALCDILAVGRSLCEEPLYISQYSRMACISIATGALERLLSRMALPEEQLVRLDEALRRAADCPEAPIRALVSESCMGMSAFSRPYDPNEGNPGVSVIEQLIPGGHSAVPWTLHAMGMGDVDLLHWLDLFEEAIAAAKMPTPEGLAAEAALKRKVEEMSSLWARRTRMMAWSVGRTVETFARNQARLDCARTAVAIERYRLAQGALPDSLDALAPTFLDAVPEDPFDGQAMRYRFIDDGYVVYSVSINQSDEEGREFKNQSEQRYQGDLIFKVERG